jgi:hypothetical protein
MNCDVFVVYARSGKNMANRVGAVLQGVGLHTIVGFWDRNRPPKCRAVVIIATGDIAEIEAAIGSAVWHQIPTFAFKVEQFHIEGNLRGYLARPTLTWIEAVSRSPEVALQDLARAVEFRLDPPPDPLQRKSEKKDIDRVASTGLRADSREAAERQEPTPESVLARPSAPAQPPSVAPSLPGRLSDLDRLRGFFSYSRHDDKNSGGALSLLREKIEHELHMQLGRRVELWQDTQDIRYGALWEAEIKRGIASSVFFVPIVTPTSINSPKCAFEFRAFQEQENAIGRNDLIFPIVYVEVSQLLDEKSWKNNERLQLVGERQYENFTELRYRSFDDRVVKQRIGKFCRSIFEALYKPTR